MTLTLVADIGGTNTRLGLAQGQNLQPDTIRRLSNADFSGLEAILSAYLNAMGMVECTRICVAVAGPVTGGVAAMTNLDWTIDSATVTRATGAKTVAILNDLQAQGHALGHIAAENLRTVIGAQRTEGNKLVIGIGTGFNAAPVQDTPWGRIVTASECGHVTMPVRTAADLRLAQFIKATDGFAGVEEVLSGRGLERLFAFVSAEAGQPAHRSASTILPELAVENGTGLVTDTARLFVRLLGEVAGNLALIHLPFGGIYLCGGVARAIAPHLPALGFAAAFHDKGRFSRFLQGFPVYVIEDDYAALTGCAAYLSQTARGR